MHFTPIPQLTFADGSVVYLPGFRTERGWVMRPDEARTDREINNGTNKSFGRWGKGGEKAAQDWWESHARTVLSGRPELLAVANTWDTPHPIDPSMWVAELDPRWGQIATGLSIRNADRKSNKPQSFKVKSWFSCVRLATAWPHWNEMADFAAQPVISVISELEMTRTEAYDKAERWMADPWLAVNTTQLIYGFEGPSGYTRDQFNFYSGGELWADRKAAVNIFTDNYAVLTDVLSQFGQLGLQIRVEADWAYMDERRIIRKVTVDIPPYDDENNQLGHTFILTPTGIKVKCGYYEDEALWAEYQKRKAEDFLSQLAEISGEIDETPAVTRPSYEEYEFTPQKEES